MKAYYRYWGKAETDGSGFHLLPYHCLDVAAVAAAWWETSPAIRRAFAVSNELPLEQLRAWVLFFVALHDYGKFDVRFQLRVKPVWQMIYPDAGGYDTLPSVQDCKTYYHGEGGLSWFMQDNPALCGTEVLPGDPFDFLDNPDNFAATHNAWLPRLEAVTGHHGHIRPSGHVADTSLPFHCDKRLVQVDFSARQLWLSALEQLFLKPAGLSLSDSPPSCSSIFLAGFCSVADWLGSRCDDSNFKYCQEAQDLSTYFDARRSLDAPRILKLGGIVSYPRTYAGVAALLEAGRQPRSLQTLVDELPLQTGLTLVEAPTGSGKTEAALAYAWRLLAAGLVDSIVFALPTQATANAMLGRLKRIAPFLFKDHPNLVLAHGSARFNDEFSKIKYIALTGYEREDGWAQCSQWLAESRKRVFLGQVGVCTVDQVLISVLPVRHRFVRGFGVGRSVLIVDEVHAYDAYMYGLLEEVLRQQKESGGAALLLSATLPEQQRQQLCAAWEAKLPPQGEEAPYPLATWTAGNIPVPYVLKPKQLPGKITVKLEPLRTGEMMPDDELLRRIIAAAETGAQVAIVCNLVDVAQKLARALRDMTGLPVDLFHARYCFSHRRRKEKRVVMRFGPKGKRRTGRILVATQVVEQSLDVDFDWLITQLCPVDLLFQRMGRLHRHDRTGRRPPGFETPLCTVLLPEKDDFGLHGLIYANTRALWRTVEKLVSAPDGEVIFPGAYRTWIEAVYCKEAWESEPVKIQQEYEAYEQELFVSHCKARQMISTAMIPLADNDENITAVTRDGEMSLTVVPFCKTSQGRMLMDGTFYELLHDDEQLEALSLNSVGVPASWRYSLENPDDGRYWLELEQDGEVFRGTLKGVAFRYHKDMGLEREK